MNNSRYHCANTEKRCQRNNFSTAVTQYVLTVLSRVLVLDISTVWELPGHDSFHVSSHSA